MKKTTFITAILLLLVSLTACGSKNRHPNVFLIPEDYNGWVQIIYNQKGFENIKNLEGKNIYQIPESGILKTSTEDAEYGVASDEYYFLSEQGERKKIDTDKMIHGHNLGSGESGNKELPTVQSFFVGTQDELKNTPNPGYPEDQLN
ncbi:DUF6843 domain-containing protein [Paenibacillus sp. FSL K6-2859]|uniref:DUF6843 domain-containing protein n=1 Tax=Paenibacillus sp. FSL K6-2859 TaxID=2921482 RepID=UPI0030F5C97B